MKTSRFCHIYAMFVWMAFHNVTKICNLLVDFKDEMKWQIKYLSKISDNSSYCEKQNVENHMKILSVQKL